MFFGLRKEGLVAESWGRGWTATGRMIIRLSASLVLITSPQTHNRGAETLLLQSLSDDMPALHFSLYCFANLFTPVVILKVLWKKICKMLGGFNFILCVAAKVR